MEFQFENNFPPRLFEVQGSSTLAEAVPGASTFPTIDPVNIVQSDQALHVNFNWNCTGIGVGWWYVRWVIGVHFEAYGIPEGPASFSSTIPPAFLLPSYSQTITIPPGTLAPAPPAVTTGRHVYRVITSIVCQSGNSPHNVTLVAGHTEPKTIQVYSD